MFLLFIGLTLQLQAQTPLSKDFADMKSGDTATVNKAQEDFVTVLVQELPTIEKDSAMLCKALSDPDPNIRGFAAGVYTTIVLAAPEHNQVVLACIPALVTVGAQEKVDKTRNNALFALAMNPAGPPPAAHAVFVSSLQSSNFRTAEVGAAGLIRETDNREENHKLVEQALAQAPDAKHRLNLLYAISGSRVPSDTLFQASQKYLYDPDLGVQQEAVKAVVATATDKSKAITVMQNLEESSSASAQQKKLAESVLNGLNTSH